MGDSPADPSPPSCCIIVGIPWKLPCCILSCKARSCINASISGNGSGATGPNLPGKGLTGALDLFSPPPPPSPGRRMWGHRNQKPDLPPDPDTSDVGSSSCKIYDTCKSLREICSALDAVHTCENVAANLSQSETESSGT